MIKTRKIPKTTVILISVVIVISLALMYVVSLSKELKVKEYLALLGYENVANISVYNKSEVKDENTKRKGHLFKIKFTNLNNNTKCRGLIFVYKKNQLPTKDIDCK